MADEALRTIVIAYRDFDDETIFKDDETTDQNGVHSYETNDLVFVGVFGIMDILRNGVPNSVLQCSQAGIKVRMITGDSKNTAIAIARQCHILSLNTNVDLAVMDGKEFMSKIGGIVWIHWRTEKCDWKLHKNDKSPMSEESEDGKMSNNKSKKSIETIVKTKYKDTLKTNLKSPNPAGNTKKKKLQVKFNDQEELFGDPEELKLVTENQKNKVKSNAKAKVRVDTIKNTSEFDSIIKNLWVLARSRPEDKYAMIVGLKERGHVVAVTGDGTNDAPALRKADVGFAMGISGTDLAKNAADIIITDDNFASIVSAIVRGRNIYDSIRKFLTFQLTVNVVAVIATFIGAVTMNHAIISPIQMLWINLIMDTLASLALATEPPNPKLLLNRKPHPKNDNIISKKMLKHIVTQSIYQLSVLALIIRNGDIIFPDLGPNIMDTDSSNEDNARLHFTYVFNVFVMMQIFNFTNSRKLNDEWNIFEGILKSKMFLLILLVIIIVQVLIVTFTAEFFDVKMWGVPLVGWGIWVAFGVGSWPVAAFTKILKEETCFCYENNSVKKDPIKEKERKEHEKKEKERQKKENEIRSKERKEKEIQNKLKMEQQKKEQVVRDKIKKEKDKEQKIKDKMNKEIELKEKKEKQKLDKIKDKTNKAEENIKLKVVEVDKTAEKGRNQEIPHINKL